MANVFKSAYDWMTGQDVNRTSSSPSAVVRNSGVKAGVKYAIIEKTFTTGSTTMYLGLDLVGRRPEDVDVDIDPDREAVEKGKNYSSRIHVQLGVPKKEDLKKSGVVFLANTFELREVDTYIPLDFYVCCGEDLEGDYDKDLGGMFIIELKKYYTGSKLKF